MRRVVAVLLGVLVATMAQATPRPGQSVPPFTVDDLEGRAHTERDFTGVWSVAIVITDKDCGPAVHAWFDHGFRALPPSVQVVSMAALDMFPLIPTATIVGRARDDAPRHRWRTIWVSRDGSLAQSLGLEESDDPWVFVIDPGGRVVEVIHSAVDAHRISQMRRALGLAP